MAKPKLSTKTPDTEDTNSLIKDHTTLIEHFNSREHANKHIALVEIGVTDVKLFEGGGQQATVVLRHVELLHGADADKAEKLFTDVYKKRTGNKERPNLADDPDTPIEGIDELDSALEG